MKLLYPKRDLFSILILFVFCCYFHLSFSQESLKVFKENFMTKLEDFSELPYWFYPYAFVLKGEDKRDDYIEIINVILRYIEKEFDLGHWKIQ